MEIEVAEELENIQVNCEHCKTKSYAIRNEVGPSSFTCPACSQSQEVIIVRKIIQPEVKPEIKINLNREKRLKNFSLESNLSGESNDQ